MLGLAVAGEMMPLSEFILLRSAQTLKSGASCPLTGIQPEYQMLQNRKSGRLRTSMSAASRACARGEEDNTIAAACALRKTLEMPYFQSIGRILIGISGNRNPGGSVSHRPSL